MEDAEEKRKVPAMPETLKKCKEISQSWRSNVQERSLPKDVSKDKKDSYLKKRKKRKEKLSIITRNRGRDMELKFEMLE